MMAFQGWLLAALLISSAAGAAADVPMTPPVPYNSYNYGIWDESVPAAPVYEPLCSINGWELGIGALKEPKDLARDTEGRIYILDSGNKRIIVLNQDLSLASLVSEFHLNGQTVALTNPEGFCVDQQGLWYIADRGAKRVVVCQPDGSIIRFITRPVTDLIDPSTDFLPTKLLVDPEGVLYVLSFGSYAGAYCFDQAGHFVGFFGSNPVYVSAKLRADRFWRWFATDEQRQRMYRYVPVEYANFAVDQIGFIYTVSNFGDQEQSGQVRKLNPLSKNILFAGRKPFLMFFGDWETVYTNRIEKSSLVAVDIDDADFISVLDLERGRVFQYDQTCNLIAIFGGPGDQTGTFRHAVDLVSSNDRILVLDDVKASVTVFQPTRYGRALREAIILYENGEYQAALEPWFEALKLDRNNHLTLRGIGRAYERLGRYEEAMNFFQQARYHGSYSNAFREWRTALLRRHFGWVACGFIVIIGGPYLLAGLVKRSRRSAASQRLHDVSKWHFPLYLVFHPFKGWEDLKRQGQGSLLIANLILAAWFILSIVEFQFTGFIFNPNRLEEMNIFLILASTIGLFLFWSTANWAICTLQDGKGSFKEIWIFSAYARMSYVLFTIPLLLVSQVLTQEEGLFLQMANWLLSAWSVIQMAMATMSVHQYSFKYTLWSMLLTLIGILFMVIIIALFGSLFAQLASFGSTIFQEILLRL